MGKEIFSIIIPTWNNPEYLNPCVVSIARTGILNGLANLIVINNGKQPIEKDLEGINNMTVLNPGENLGWEGGLKLGLENSTTPFVCFQNDDTFIPKANYSMYERLLLPFNDKKVAAVGPSTTICAGKQSIYYPNPCLTLEEMPYLIFFTVMMRRSALDEVGGIDTTLPGGDDFDLSLRLRQAGYKLLCNPDAFLIHHAFKTGERVKGSSNVDGGWNSVTMQERTNKGLIQKHGFRNFFSLFMPLAVTSPEPPKDLEGDLVRTYISEGEKVLEVGCGPVKTVPSAIGADIAGKGENIREHEGRVSSADVTCDVTKELPFQESEFDCIIARHILEHCLDTVATISHWKKVLKEGGKLIIAVPDESITAGIPLNPEHCHAFSQESLKNIIECCGFIQQDSKSSNNGVSFVSCFLKTAEANAPFATITSEAERPL